MLAPPTTEMNLEVTVLREVSQSLKDTDQTPFVCAPLCGLREEGREGEGWRFQFCKARGALGTDGPVGCTVVWTHLPPLKVIKV